MASSDDRGRDNSSTPSSSKSENPFIKFRQNVDSHISSLLQGILGLPSAFSNKTSENGRWADFDEDLRRRDELKARQQQLKDSEARRNTQPAEEEVNIPVRKSPDWEKSSSYCGSTYLPLGHNSVDLPLYAPIEKSLFRHLHSPADGDVEWQLPASKAVATSECLAFSMPGICSLRPDQISADALKMTQLMAYNMLNHSGTYLRSQASVVPYLLFSPYSPLMLEASTSGHQNGENDKFPYGQAFAELLSTTERRLPTDVGFHYLTRHSSPLMEAYRNVKYIVDLDAKNLLHHCDSERSGRMHWTDDKPKPESESAVKNPTTEQQMYDTFLRLASLPASTSSNFESLFKEIEKAIDEQLDPKLRAQKDAWKKEHITESQDIEGGLNQVDEIWKSLGTAFKEEKAKEEKKKKAGTTQASDRVVSTRTTTEHFKHEDGSVETKVTVERTFADGRETQTTTSHVEFSPDAESALGSDANWERSEQGNKPEQDSAENKKLEKKGWFWN